MDQGLYQSQLLQPDQIKYWEIAKSQDQQNFIDNLERQLLDLQFQKKEQEDQAVKTIEFYQKTIEEKNNLLDQYQVEKNQIKSRQINVQGHVDNINSLSLEVKRLKSELRQKNDRIFQLEKKVQQLEDDYNFDIKLLNNKRNYEKALTYKLMQSQVVVENTSLKLINQGLEKQISELNRRLLMIENESKANKQSLRNLQVDAAARKQQEQLNYEDRIRIEKLLKGLDDEETNNEKIVEVFKDEMLLQGVVEIFTRMRKMIVRNLNKQFVKSNRLSQKGELNSVIAFKDIIYAHVSNKKDEEISSYLLLYRQFKELIQHYYPQYGKIIFYRQQQQQSEEELKSLQSTDQVNDKINQSIQIIQERDEINNWLLTNLVLLKSKRKQEKYNLKRDEKQQNKKNEADQILFQSRHLFQYLALYLRLQHINQKKSDQDDKVSEGQSVDSDDQNTKFDIDQDLQINLEEQIVIQYYRLLQILIKL
ncbi:hypothetical protein TTHERM_00196030 (macronuclear) [Tetrahymena thermophila SB210]|uniref:Uncharacterized protein n=1 Tax=Tetrahymena thermophila (strain SB210) TaxID=312017 RepID=Q23K31_TETTS|nr:hypothetical protein TTHERM_00196030 [Tetrahymena thermophila SB210]EAR97012.2 hypothetical protein TTHERM_00196030 [Tetrahymena thermophila SB210]|eukprot:XP_001017257.2 hypothetical protein TTHERM_00196030 [Tetrahymena thermophila SB210]